MPSSHVSLKATSPLKAFLDRGVITDAFMERYAYAHVHYLLKQGEARANDSFVVGWDPRDPEGIYTEAVIRGVRKAGLNALVIGIAPTPLVPMFAQYKNAAGGFMVTASHNPKDQNGIKTFLAYRGMKLLPENDIALTRTLMNLKSIQRKRLIGKRLDCRWEALDLFVRFSLDPVNSWADNVSFKDIILVVDPARGALSGLAERVFRRAGFGKVVACNSSLKGKVNWKSGVADLEGHSFIPAASIEKGVGAFSGYPAILKVFELGRQNRRKVQSGSLQVCGAVFDADGDRFYRLDYHPGKDGLIVSSGDETAFMQAKYLRKLKGRACRSTAYINTVESDLNTALAAETMGFRSMISPVGDKWILLRVAQLIVESKLQRLSDASVKVGPLEKKLKRLKQSDRLDVMALRDLESEIDALEIRSKVTDTSHPLNIPFSVGSEETGHNITLGWMQRQDGVSLPVFFGNGLKSALNTFAATQVLLKGKAADARLRTLEKPFSAGFKQTHYVYYIRKEKFRNGSSVWKKVLTALRRSAQEQGYDCKARPYPEDPDMLYIHLQGSGNARAAVFVRNSGTENKISVNLRGGKGQIKTLQQIGEEAIRILFRTMKDEGNRFYKIERDLLSRASGNPLNESGLKDDSERRVLAEMGKQGLLQRAPQGMRLTERGKWYMTGQ